MTPPHKSGPYLIGEKGPEWLIPSRAVTPTRERRPFTLGSVTLRAEPGGRGMRFRGHAAVFKQRTWIGPQRHGFWEEVAPGAFDRALDDGQDVAFLVDHDPAKVLARTPSGTLRLSKDKTGLVADADLADVSYGRDLAVLLERGDLSHMSFAFTVPDGGAEEVEQKDGTWLRRLNDVDLFDVSVVAYPAYAGTDAALRTVEARRADCHQARLLALRRRLQTLKGD